MGELVKICICYIQELNEITMSENYFNTFENNQNLKPTFIYSGQQKTQIARIGSSFNSSFKKLEKKKFNLKNSPKIVFNDDKNKITLLTSRKYLEKYKKNDFLYRHGDNLKINKVKKNISTFKQSNRYISENFSKVKQGLWTLFNKNEAFLKRVRLSVSAFLVGISILFLLYNFIIIDLKSS